MTHANLRHIRLAGIPASSTDDQTIRRARSMLVLRQRVAGIAQDAARADARTRDRVRTTKVETKRAFKEGRWPSTIRLGDLALGE